MRPIEAGDFARLIQKASLPALVVMWSIDCAPCHHELPQLAQMARSKRFASILLISTDEPDKVPELARTLSSVGFPSQVSAFVFGKTDATRLRFEIDPAWRGETPRQYLYAPSQPVRGWSGPVKSGHLGAAAEH